MLGKIDRQPVDIQQAGIEPKSAPETVALIDPLRVLAAQCGDGGVSQVDQSLLYFLPHPWNLL